ncbi:hypothetical protein G8770_15240 [Aestuariicella hydrocarbonica]|uniref:Uncharacterized protein n=1 Tax=Pseudomaricurvus hydrocarbonicus TaxID=1470433 RepID=A0A9E5MMJ2_9GAMM|nr:hypothetical protein [Aestuariicella hydrocarbonica]NHO66905.1 hypothetical protein [Aestuariicella hydrocarbonica]
MERPGGSERNRWCRVTTTDDLKSLDVRKLARNAGLANQSFRVEWMSGDEYTGSIDVKTSRQAIELNYRIKTFDFWRVCEQVVSLVYTSCHFGRKRPWFSCPGCLSRCAILYLGGSGFACRVCYGLLYRSQTLSKLDRYLYQRVALEKRLYGDEGCFKPGVHSRTRSRVWEKYMALQEKISTELMG